MPPWYSGAFSFGRLPATIDDCEIGTDRMALTPIPCCRRYVYGMRPTIRAEIPRKAPSAFRANPTRRTGLAPN